MWFAGFRAESRLAEQGLSAEHREELDQILKQSRRAGKLLSGLLRFVRPPEGKQSAVVVHDVVRGAVDLVAHQVLEGAVAEMLPQVFLGDAEAAHVVLRQVDAVPGLVVDAHVLPEVD